MYPSFKHVDVVFQSKSVPWISWWNLGIPFYSLIIDGFLDARDKPTCRLGTRRSPNHFSHDSTNPFTHHFMSGEGPSLYAKWLCWHLLLNFHKKSASLPRSLSLAPGCRKLGKACGTLDWTTQHWKSSFQHPHIEYGALRHGGWDSWKCGDFQHQQSQFKQSFTQTHANGWKTCTKTDQNW